MNGLPEKMTLSLKSIKKNNYDFPKEKWDGYLVMYNDFFSQKQSIINQSLIIKWNSVHWTFQIEVGIYCCKKEYCKQRNIRPPFYFCPFRLRTQQANLYCINNTCIYVNTTASKRIQDEAKLFASVEGRK